MTTIWKYPIPLYGPNRVPDTVGEYVGTWQSAIYVFHLFEVTL